MNLTAAVVTATTGSPYLLDCIRSVQEQTFQDVKHYIFVDGADYANVVDSVILGLNGEAKGLYRIQLPENTGGGKHHGYRICAGAPHFVNQDVLFFLDDDNIYEREHVEFGMSAIEKYKVEWGFSLRKLITETGDFLDFDNCDSLGFWRRAESYLGPADALSQEFCSFYAANSFLVDTSCFFGKTEFVRNLSHLFLEHPRGDAFFASELVRKHSGACTGQYSMQYRVRRQNEDNTRAYFQRGNIAMERRYCGRLPWTLPSKLDALNVEG